MDKKPTPEELRKRHEDAVEQSIATFPFRRIEVEGTQALVTWEGLRLTDPGLSPVVVGGLEEFKRIVSGATAWPGGPAGAIGTDARRPNITLLLFARGASDSERSSSA